MGFTNIMMVGDSGGNQRGMEQVADELNREWKGEPARVFFITEYYTEDRWSYDFMKEELGIVQMPDTQSATRWDIHDDYHYESLVAVSNPRLLRETERTKAGRFSIYGWTWSRPSKSSRTGRSWPTTGRISRLPRSRRRWRNSRSRVTDYQLKRIDALILRPSRARVGLPKNGEVITPLKLW